MKNFLLLSIAVLVLIAQSCTKHADMVEGDVDRIQFQQGSVTGQSVQLNFEIPTTFVEFNFQETWTYNAAFDDYFDAVITGTPNTGAINAQKNQVLNANRCNFWSGDNLTGGSQNWGGQGPNQGSITITPKQPNYPARTGWNLSVNADDLEASVENIFVASASHLSKARQSGGWRNKYSFDLRDEEGNPRVENLQIELLLNGSVIETRSLEGTLENGVDFIYNANAGNFGNHAAVGALNFANGQMVNVTQGTNAFDDFNGNNGTGGSKYVVGDQTFSGLTLEGLYAIRISGVVKGNAGESGDNLISVTRTIIVQGGCNN